MIDPNADALDAQNEATARKLKADGYRAAVVLQKMIQIHHMGPRAAEELVSRVFDTPVKVSVAGERRRDLMKWLSAAGVSWSALAIFYFSHGFPDEDDPMGQVFLLVSAFSVASFIGLVRSAFLGMIEDGARRE